jgi:hypothetical protein
MSRSGYVDDLVDSWQHIRWRGAVTAALRGARGYAFLNEMLAALDALPSRELVAGELEKGGAVCALGAVGKARGLEMDDLDPEDSARVASVFGIADALAREIVFLNDEGAWEETPAQRFNRMREWLKAEIWNVRGCVADPYGTEARRMSRRIHWNSVIEWNEV